MDLDDIAAMGEAKPKSDEYRAALQRAVESGDASACRRFVDHVLSDAVPLVLSRQLLMAFAQSLQQLAPEAQQSVATYALEKVQPRAVSYEEQVGAVREQLAAVYKSHEEWSKAASALAGIDLDSGMRVLDAEYKLGKLVQIAMLYLEDDDAVAAETYIKKASSLLAACKNEELELQYKTCYARILDSKRRFLEAATRYYELSQVGKRKIGDSEISEEDLEQALQSAIKCAVLAAAGPQRSRMLATLYKDERCAKLSLFPFLEKVYLERILQPGEVESFAQGLQQHQLAKLPDGSTVLERSVTEHNLEAASKLYANIYTSELGALLGVSADKAEAVASRMVLESRLQAVIDQVEGLITFKAAEQPLQQWDRNIAALCQSVNQIVDEAAARGVRLPAAAPS
ncbi:COP9 signalosome complex subunit 4 [Micractinium conductrix]|uniref:COP9 signalosome complex subunit 4 n=1 Tax=Micractinium conductrix TaxID=554055 RepID=A0A2P6V5W9_9CHLO|nr:COP9 signalosome complex subunit 4 [Micractinium conductrix]|eukprot:PSC69483.1 COP9 signalosome complex subunit 4 [Micractinium conductrix]